MVALQSPSYFRLVSHHPLTRAWTCSNPPRLPPDLSLGTEVWDGAVRRLNSRLPRHVIAYNGIHAVRRPNLILPYSFQSKYAAMSPSLRVFFPDRRLPPEVPARWRGDISMATSNFCTVLLTTHSHPSRHGGGFLLTSRSHTWSFSTALPGHSINKRERRLRRKNRRLMPKTYSTQTPRVHVRTIPVMFYPIWTTISNTGSGGHAMFRVHEQ